MKETNSICLPLNNFLGTFAKEFYELAVLYHCWLTCNFRKTDRGILSQLNNFSMKSTKPKWDTPDGHSPAVAFFSQFGPVPKVVVEEMDKRTFPVYVKKRKLLLRPGAPADHIYLIVKGIIHGFVKVDGKQVTTWLNGENELFGALNVMGSNHSEEFLQALEDTLVIAIPMIATEEIFTKYPETNVIGRRLWQLSYHKAVERAFTIRISSAKKRYLRFVETHPNISNRVPLKYIASYLGIAQETLSRIRSKKIIIRP